MKNFILVLITLIGFTLSGCAHIKAQQERYPLLIDSQTIGHHLTLRATDAGKRVFEAKVEIENEAGRIFFSENFDARGSVRLRIPVTATRLVVIITDTQGRQGKRTLFLEDLRDEYDQEPFGMDELLLD